MAKETHQQPIKGCIPPADWPHHYDSGDPGEDSEARIVVLVYIIKGIMDTSGILAYVIQ